MKYIFLLISGFILFFSVAGTVTLKGQNSVSGKINSLQIKISESKSDKEKDSLSRLTVSYVKELLANGKIDKLNGIKPFSVLESDDGKFQIVTWPVLYSEDEFHYAYYGAVRYYNPDFGRYDVLELKDKSSEIKNPERQKLYPENWFGAFYYKVIKTKYKKSVCYVLLGWNGNDDLTDKKVIEVFSLDENNEPVFGKDIFEYENGNIFNRLIFEYKEGIGMSLKYDDSVKKIVWDHLSPSKPSLKGHYEYYGPDLTYDALYFDKGIWRYIPDYDITEK